jgi:hypothetical protein
VASPWQSLPLDPVAAGADLSQRVLPELRARQTAAERQVAARQAYFAGEERFEVAFPRLEHATLDRDDVLAGRLAQLDDRSVERSAERVA